MNKFILEVKPSRQRNWHFSLFTNSTGYKKFAMVMDFTVDVFSKNWFLSINQ